VSLHPLGGAEHKTTFFLIHAGSVHTIRVIIPFFSNTGMLRESTLLSILQSLRWLVSIYLVKMCLHSTLGGYPLVHRDPFKYLGMMFYMRMGRRLQLS
jgi:hypothetical protein